MSGMIQRAQMWPSKALVAQGAKLPKEVIAYHEHQAGLRRNEPVMMAMDALYRYAERYKREYDGTLSDDGFLGQPWLDALKGVRALLNGPGDFDGGTLEGLFWEALDVAGFKEEDL